MTSMATDTCHVSRLSMNACSEDFSRTWASSKGMFFDEFFIWMASIAGIFYVGGMGHRFWIFTGKNVMFPMAIITVGCPLSSLHYGLGMETLLIFLILFLVAHSAFYFSIWDLLPPWAWTSSLMLVWQSEHESRPWTDISNSASDTKRETSLPRTSFFLRVSSPWQLRQKGLSALQTTAAGT